MTIFGPHTQCTKFQCYKKYIWIHFLKNDDCHVLILGICFNFFFSEHGSLLMIEILVHYFLVIIIIELDENRSLMIINQPCNKIMKFQFSHSTYDSEWESIYSKL